MPHRVRKWEERDTPEVVDVVRSVYDDYGFIWDENGYHADLYDVQEHYLEQGDSFFVAEESGQVVGVIALERFELIPGELGDVVEHGGKLRMAGTDCSMERLYVHATSRKSGIGSALVNRVVQTAREEGRRAMEIWSDKRFEEAHRLYQRLGGEVIGERICDDPDVSPEWGILLRLRF